MQIIRVVGLSFALGALMSAGCDQEKSSDKPAPPASADASEWWAKSPLNVYRSDIRGPEVYCVSVKVNGQIKDITTNYWEFDTLSDLTDPNSKVIVFRFVGGNIGAGGITPPANAAGKDAALDAETEPKDSKGVVDAALDLKQGFMHVTAFQVNDGSAEGLKAEAEARERVLKRHGGPVKMLIPGPFRVVLLRGMSTGAYGSSYTLASTPSEAASRPEAKDCERQLQTIFWRSGTIKYDKRATDPAANTLSKDMQSTLQASCELGPQVKISKADEDAFLAEAKSAYDKTKTKHDGKAAQGPCPPPSAPAKK